MLEKPELSLVIPVYNEEESLDKLCQWIDRVMEENKISHEVILVDDGSRDRSWSVISQLTCNQPHYKGIRFSRNYGKSAALDTGFRLSSGKVVVTLDADMQDSPDEIPLLLDMLKNGDYDLVSGWKKTRHDPISKTIPSRFFNFITRKISGIRLHDFNCGLKAYRSEVVKNIRVYGEMHRYIPVIAKWQGFDRIGEKSVTHYPRKYGKTKFGLERFINGFLDLISITFVMRFIKKPMHFFGSLGTLSFLVGLAITIYIISHKIYQIRNHIQPIRDITDQPLFYLALVAVIIGVQMFLTGFLAEILTLNSDKTSQYIILERKGFSD
ncbi:MAG: glycosyltransferase family 2 protein [Cyclobacteriaceae bacterium]|nr:glycosyltransferase family 2 protein [Cyclobacteriaceae bacterium]